MLGGSTNVYFRPVIHTLNVSIQIQIHIWTPPYSRQLSCIHKHIFPHTDMEHIAIPEHMFLFYTGPVTSLRNTSNFFSKTSHKGIYLALLHPQLPSLCQELKQIVLPF